MSDADFYSVLSTFCHLSGHQVTSSQRCVCLCVHSRCGQPDSNHSSCGTEMDVNSLTEQLQICLGSTGRLWSVLFKKIQEEMFWVGLCGRRPNLLNLTHTHTLTHRVCLRQLLLTGLQSYREALFKWRTHTLSPPCFSPYPHSLETCVPVMLSISHSSRAGYVSISLPLSFVLLI